MASKQHVAGSNPAWAPTTVYRRAEPAAPIITVGSEWVHFGGEAVRG
jgi:hypothetical protein